MVFAWLILEAVGDSMLTRLRKEKNFKNWVFKLFPQWIYFHQSIFPIMCWHLWERREGSRVIKWRFEFPHTDLQMFWWLTVLKQNDPGRKHMWMGKPSIWGDTKWTKLSQTFWNVDLINWSYSLSFSKYLFSGDGPDNRAGVHSVNSRDLSSGDHGHLVNDPTQEGEVSYQEARFCTRMYFLLFTMDHSEVHIVLRDFKNS